MNNTFAEGVGEGLPQGPEHRIGEADLAIVKAEVSAFYADATAQGEYPEGRYPEHLERVTEFLHVYGVDAPVMEMAVYLHDVVDHYFVKRDHDRDEGATLIGRLYDEVEDKNMLTRALMYCDSASDWEYQVAQTVRDEILKAVSEELGPGNNLSPEKIKALTVVMGAISNTLGEQDEETERILKDTRLGDINFAGLDLKSLERLMSATVNRGLAGPVIKGGEVYDNLDHKPPGNPASTYRDAQESRYCWFPILKLFRYGDMGAAVEGKAYESLYDDPNGYAQRQAYLSLIYGREIEGIVGINIDEPSSTPPEYEFKPVRAKTKGSDAKKLAGENYEGLEYVPDGVGLRIIVPDGTPPEEIRNYALELRKILAEREDIEIWHPRDSEERQHNFEDYITDPKDSGYQAVHMTFYYRSPEGIVPFEIQVLTKEHDFYNEYGDASHVMYRTGSKFIDVSERERLERFGRMSDKVSDSSDHPETMPAVWASHLARFPEFETPIHRVFSLHTTYIDRLEGETVDDRFRRRYILGPKELEGIDFKEFFEAHPEISDLETIILPPSHVDEQSFYDLLEFIDPKLGGSMKIRKAVAMIKDALADDRRHSGHTTLEGHLLPTALHAVIMAVSNGEHWENENPTELLEKIAVLDILHDSVEDMHFTFKEIEAHFGTEMAKDVYAMSSPQEIEDDYERREAYTQKIIKRFKDVRRKLPDRMDNIMSDIVELIKHPDHPRKPKMFDYAGKTDTHFSARFNKLPSQYRHVRDVTWYILEKLGYTYESWKKTQENSEN